MIKDSGTRREFETGAVRDIQEGKGRCDLLPLDAVAAFFSHGDNYSTYSQVLRDIHKFTISGNINLLCKALEDFFVKPFGTGPTMFLEVSKHFEEGAKKYGEYNWQKGIPTHCYIDSAVRHFLKFIRGDKDEPHDRAFVWNILCCIWTCKNKPELNDYPRKEVEGPKKEETLVETHCETCKWEYLDGCEPPCYSCTYPSFHYWEPKEETEGNT